jgi:hypothetical protein
MDEFSLLASDIQQSETSDTSAVRSTFFIDDKGILRAMVYYPMTNGHTGKLAVGRQGDRAAAQDGPERRGAAHGRVRVHGLVLLQEGRILAAKGGP